MIDVGPRVRTHLAPARSRTLSSAPPPTRAVVVSALGHVGAFAACLAWSAYWQAAQPKTYIVNLVPSVAAVGSPSGRADTKPTGEEPAPRVARFAPRRAESARAAEPRPSIREAARIPPPPEPARATPRATATARDVPALPSLTIPRAAPPPAPAATVSAPALTSRPVVRRFDGDDPAPRPRPVERATVARVARIAATEPVPRRSQPRDVPLEATRWTPTPPTVAPLDGARRALPGPVPPEAPARTALATPTIRPESLPRAGAKDLPSVASGVNTALAPTPPAPALPASAPTKAPPVPVPPPPPLGQPTGSAQGKGALTMQASDFPFTLYLQTVQRKVHERWAPPPRGADGRAVIVFEIGRDGSVRKPAVENSSGDAVYDQAALRAITDANPFPPLPEGFREAILRIHLGFDFAPNRG